MACAKTVLQIAAAAAAEHAHWRTCTSGFGRQLITHMVGCFFYLDASCNFSFAHILTHALMLATTHALTQPPFAFQGVSCMQS